MRTLPLTLSQALAIEEKDVVLVVGSGGKTTLCTNLCAELKTRLLVFYTTTTKIYPPKNRDFKICLGKDVEAATFSRPGVYVLGMEMSDEGKLLPFNESVIRTIARACDVLVAEADGAKMKPLKGWNASEPVFLRATTKTVAVIPISTVGQPIDHLLVHRLAEFQELIGCSAKSRIEIGDLFRVITHEKGLFKDAVGMRILVINQAESAANQQYADHLVALLKNSATKIDRIVIASLKNKSYTVVMPDWDGE